MDKRDCRNCAGCVDNRIDMINMLEYMKDKLFRKCRENEKSGKGSGISLSDIISVSDEIIDRGMNKHILGISTVDALLLCQALNEDNFIHSIDKELANKIKNYILDVVSSDLRAREGNNI